MAEHAGAFDFDLLFDDEQNADFEREINAADVDEDVDERDWTPEAPTQQSHIEPRPVRVDTRPPAERIAEVMSSVGLQRRTLLDILEACQMPAPASKVESVVAESQRFNRSVLDAYNLCRSLEEAGALERTDAEGANLVEENGKPEEIIIGDAVYLKPKKPDDTFWCITEAGATYLAADDPRGRLQAAFEEHPEHLPVYINVLQFLADHAEEGVTVAQLGGVVDHDPLVQKPRFYAGHFVDRLERAEALQWRDKWFITELGKSALAELKQQTEEE